MEDDYEDYNDLVSDLSGDEAGLDYLIDEEIDINDGETEITSDETFSYEKTLPDEIIDTTNRDMSDKKMFKSLKQFKEKEYYNRMEKSKFIASWIAMTKLLKMGATPYISIPELHDNYEYCNEETLALIHIMAGKSNLYTNKQDRIYNEANYPPKDVINCFRYFYKYLQDNKSIIKLEPLLKYFPTIIKNLDSIIVTKEEIDECINIEKIYGKK
jgi:hypothetical protein